MSTSENEHHTLSIDVEHSDDVPKRSRRSIFLVVKFFKTLQARASITLSRQRSRNQNLPETHYPYSRLDRSSRFTIDGTKLAQLVKHKNLDFLQELGNVPGLLSALDTNVDHGIPGGDGDVATRRATFGSNALKIPLAKAFFWSLLKYFKSMADSIFLTCAVLSLALSIADPSMRGEVSAVVMIVVAVFFEMLLAATVMFSLDIQILKHLTAVDRVKLHHVVRSGHQQLISKADIVVGDVILLKMGDQVPADGLFLDGHSFLIDEPVPINPDNPFLLSGAKAVDGWARMLVTCVGYQKVPPRGQITQQTPLQAELKKESSSAQKIGILVALLCLVVLLVRYFTGLAKDEDGDPEFNVSEKSVLRILDDVVWIVASAASVGDVAIPDNGADKFVLISFLNRMKSHEIVVNKLFAFETMGFVTTLCTNKTGALTLGEMEVIEFWLGQEPVEENIASSSSLSISGTAAQLVQQGIALNRTASFYESATSKLSDEFLASPTEKAILSWAVEKMNMKLEDYKDKANFAILKFQVFNSQRKMSGVLVHKKADDSLHIHWTGAAEMILAMCSTYREASGNMKSLDNEQREKLNGIIQGMAAQGLSCTAFAHKQLAADPNLTDIHEDELTLLGIIGIKKQVQTEVKKTVEIFKDAGVDIKIITGDHLFTAQAIANECGIIDMSSGVVVSGEQFQSYTQEDRMERVNDICVMARCSPDDRHLMLQCLKNKGSVIAIITVENEANIGLSIARINKQDGQVPFEEGSDIVILGRDFGKVAKISRWGRCFQTNIKKFIQFRLTVSISTLVINLVTSFVSSDVSLTVVQSIWLSLILDVLAPQAFSKQLPSSEYMKKASDAQPLLSNIMLRNILGQALYQIAIVLTLHFKGKSLFSVTKDVKDTLIFNVSVLCQIANMFNARKFKKKNVFKGLHRSKSFWVIIGITIVVQVVMVQFPTTFVGAERLNWEQWGVCIGIAFVSLPIGWVVKCVPVPEKPFLNYVVKYGQTIKEQEGGLIQYGETLGVEKEEEEEEGEGEGEEEKEKEKEE